MRRYSWDTVRSGLASCLFRWRSSAAPHRRLGSGHRNFSPASERLEPRQMLAANVLINEIHYDPDVKTELVEFIELYNAGDEIADLSG